MTNTGYHQRYLNDTDLKKKDRLDIQENYKNKLISIYILTNNYSVRGF
jgi:hypothetical protein